MGEREREAVNLGFHKLYALAYYCFVDEPWFSRFSIGEIGMV